MAIETKTKAIGSHEYSITLLDADKGVRITGQLAKYVIGPLGAMVLGDLGDKPEVAAAGVKQLGEYLGDEEFLGIVKALLVEARCDKKPIMFASHFAGNYGELVDVVIFALKENFGSFLVGSETLRGVREKVGAMFVNLPSMVQSRLSSHENSQPSTSSRASTVSAT